MTNKLIDDLIDPSNSDHLKKIIQDAKEKRIKPDEEGYKMDWEKEWDESLDSLSKDREKKV